MYGINVPNYIFYCLALCSYDTVCMCLEQIHIPLTAKWPEEFVIKISM